MLTLEHIIPRFLGGAYAPDNFKTRKVCDRCNNDLGLFADAAFEKAFLVSTELRECTKAFFDPKKPTALPLNHMGEDNLTPPHMKKNEICESWLGPLGEQIYWIRPKDPRTYWYSGGNPRTVKKSRSRAYFFFSKNSDQGLTVTLRSFHDAFSGYKVKKILCGTIDGFNMQTIGFSDHDEIDELRAAYFLTALKSGYERQGKITMYQRYDLRLMAKLAIGISYSLFGYEILNSRYSQELYKALWFREENEIPKIYGSLSGAIQNPFLTVHCGVKYGVTITVIPSPESITINLNINQSMNWSITCARVSELSQQNISELGDGICIILYKTLQTGFQISLTDLLAHNSKAKTIPKLRQIEESAGRHNHYIESLTKLGAS